MGEKIQEVLYETRHHAKGSVSSNYPPLQQDDSAKGGLLSLLSVQGVKRLKEKWDERKNSRRQKKWMSLFVSFGGEYVAVASGNKITILRKDDDYKEPCGIFSGHNKLATFTYGAWSDIHDVLGVIDENDTFYFIKSSGDELFRITKKQLKVSMAIRGLIVQGDLDGQQSCFFSVLTSDGLLHSVDVRQDPSESLASLRTSNLKTHFSHGISCLDYHPDSQLLVVVGCHDDVNSRDISGMYCISLWRITRSLDPGLVFCSSQFEGLFSTVKGCIDPFTNPKVVISPQSNYIAALDITGKLDVFNLVEEQNAISVITFDGSRDRLNGIADFTWWSDSILILAKLTGVVTMLDILSGAKLMDSEPIFSMPVLGRVQQCQGCVFVLESLSCEDRASHVERETLEMENKRKGKGAQDRFDPLDIGKLSWNLISFSERSVSAMYSSLISNQQYQVATEFANRHGLDKDEILKSQWLLSDRGTNEINKYLSNIKDKEFVLSECLEKVGPTEDSAKALIFNGLRVTDNYKFLESEENESSKIWDFRMGRLHLLQYRDRLETFVGINMGRFSMQEYRKFRTTPLSEVAVTLAESGKIGALNLLFKRHPYSLAPFVLEIFSAIPETIPVQTYRQLLPGRSPPATINLRDEDWVECEKMVNFISELSTNLGNSITIKTEPILKKNPGYFWPSVDELSSWYKTRARDIDISSGQLDNSASLVEVACRKGIVELQPYHEEILCLYQLIYSDETDMEDSFTMSLVSWEELSDYEKFKMMIDRVKEDRVYKRLSDKAIPFMQSRAPPLEARQTESFLVRWLKEIAADNKLDICATVIENGCGDFGTDSIFTDEVEAVECALQCIYLCSLTDRWNTMASILSKLPKLKDTGISDSVLEKRLLAAEGHVDAGRLLAYYQVPKPIKFFLESQSDEKGVKQILRLILSKFGRRQPGRSDNDWANIWRDMQCFQEKAFPFLDLEYMLMEFCRGLLKAGKFSLARNYLKGTSTVCLTTEKAENLVIQAAREYFFSASSLACAEIWKAKECLNIFPNSRNVKAEADIVDALTVKLPNLGVIVLPVEFRQIKNPMEIINKVITTQIGAYLNVDELIEIANLLGLHSQEDIAAVQEAVAREAAVSGDLQLAFDLCLILAKKGHGSVWDLCAAIARGPFLDNMDSSSRKQLLGFSLCHCDEESISELLHAWKNLDMQSQCETLAKLAGTTPPNVSVQGSLLSLPVHSNQDIANINDCSAKAENYDDQEIHLREIKNLLSTIAKDLSVEDGNRWDSLLENGKVLSFAALQLPWMIELSRKEEYGKKMASEPKPAVRRRYTTVRTQCILTILSWLARNDIAPTDDFMASLAKSIMQSPVTEDEDLLGCSILLNLVDAFLGVEIIEGQLKSREAYQEICNIMNMGMAYGSLNNTGAHHANPAKKRELLLCTFQEKHLPLSPDTTDGKVQSTFWREWKSKLEEQKLFTDQSKNLEKIVPGVDTARFLSGDNKYIENVVSSLIDGVKLEKKPGLKEVLKLAGTYGLNCSEVLLGYLCSALVSEIWSNSEIISEISDQKRDILSCAAALIGTISSNVYPAINGCNKERLSYIFSLLSECYSHIIDTEERLVDLQSDPTNILYMQLAEFYKTLDQECRRTSFIKSLNFKNIAVLGGLNASYFNEEVYSNIDENTVEALAEMVGNLVGIFPDSELKGLISRKSVYRHYVLTLLTSFMTDFRANINFSSPENFHGFLCELEQNYSCVRNYVRAMSQEDVFDITQQYYMSSLPVDFSSESLPGGDSEWLDCLISLLKFWISLANDVHDSVSYDNVEGKVVKVNAETLSQCLKVFIELLMEDKIFVDQGWNSISNYARHGLGGFPGEALGLCKSMVVSGCGFESISLVFTEAKGHYLTNSGLELEGRRSVDGVLDLPHLYVNILDSLLLNLESESRDRRNLHHLLSTLSRLEGDLEALKSVRYAVWTKLGTFSDNMQLQSHLRVYALELLQSITGRNLRGLPADLLSNIEPWEGWDESCCSIIGHQASDQTASSQPDSANRFTSNLVALKSTRLAAKISPSVEILPDDLLTLESAVTCFMSLSEVAKSETHFEALQHILEEWEGLFTREKIVEEVVEEKNPGEESEVEKGSWSGDEWDEGWESFQEEQPVLRKNENEEALSVHPLHSCWMVVMKKFLSLNQFADILKVIDQSLSKSNVILLDEGDAQSLAQLLLGIDCVVALKLVLLLPYQAIHLQCLDELDVRLTQRSLSKTGGDFELFSLFLSSGTISTIASNPKYRATFSYVCYSAGRFSHLCQATQLSELKSRERLRSKSEENDLTVFRTVLFPCFVSELVKGKQPVLAGFLVNQFMHTTTIISVINVVDASLRKYLEGHMQMLDGSEHDVRDTGICRHLGNTILGLRSNMTSLIQSALSSL